MIRITISDSDADDHVQRVHAGHREINPVEHLDMLDCRASEQMQLVRIECRRVAAPPD